VHQVADIFIIIVIIIS